MMNYKEKQNWLVMKYPCTVIADRYNGTYSDAAYLAFPLDFYDVPKDVSGEDNECAYFWYKYAEPVGKGASPQEAIDDLVAQMQNENEKIRKGIVETIKQCTDILSPKNQDEMLAYLEKQKENIEKEYVFRPLPGTDITIAAEQAIRRAKEGDHLVLAFNGVYLPVRKYNSAKELVDEYDAYLENWLEKQKEQQPAEWSEKEKKIISSIRHLLFDHAFENGGVDVNGDYCKDEYEAADDFLKTLRPQPQAEWSEEDNIGWDEAFACVTRAEKAAKNEEELQNAVTAEKWLKEIKFKYYVHPVKREWSEEDEEMWMDIKCNLIHGSFLPFDKIEWLETRLKSLRPQPKWKPSEEEQK